MKRQISAQYGTALELAASDALAVFAREQEVAAMCNFSVDYTFDYHGIEIPLTSATTAGDLVKQITEELATRAALYDATPAAPTAFTREQGGKLYEHLYDAIPSSIQCGQRWGNGVYDKGCMAELRHAFEFNGIKVPFNPWKKGEAGRVLQEVEDQLRKSGKPPEYYVRPARVAEDL